MNAREGRGMHFFASLGVHLNLKCAYVNYEPNCELEQVAFEYLIDTPNRVFDL